MNLNYLRREDLHKGNYYFFEMGFTRAGALIPKTVKGIRECYVDLYHGADGIDMWEVYESSTYKLFIFREYELTEEYPTHYLAETYEDAVDLWNKVLQTHIDVVKAISDRQIEIMQSKTL